MATIVKEKKKAVPKVVKDLSWNKWIGEDIARTKCLCCGVNEIKMSSFHCGHVLAVVNGGTTTVDNLRPICAACNLSMGTTNFDDFKKQCGFNSIPKIAEKTKPSEEEIKKSKIEQLLIKDRQLLLTGKLKKCEKRNYMEFNGCVLSNYGESHCMECHNHYSLGGKLTTKCPCLSI